ncbi:Hypothetical predicted protein [Octopus vulgaris]|uniref:Uncharacterized protein n=1 Tax=Octopus vulgaris TaxID=6645 RepID=A0AA36BQH0_OCTVU|nr:Hypothetical predicted protein [Octopus vulgaris]
MKTYVKSDAAKTKTNRHIGTNEEYKLMSLICNVDSFCRIGKNFTISQYVLKILHRKLHCGAFKVNIHYSVLVTENQPQLFTVLWSFSYISPNFAD